MADTWLMNNLYCTAEFEVSLFSNRCIFAHRHNGIGVTNDMDQRDACLGQDRQVVQRNALIVGRLLGGKALGIEASLPGTSWPLS